MNNNIFSNINSPVRKVEINTVLSEIDQALKLLKINKWSIPNIEVKFISGKYDSFSAEIDPTKEPYTILANEIFKSKKLALKNGFSFRRIMAHELGHIILESLTGLSRQPATKLINEGWAKLIENLVINKPSTLNEYINNQRKRFKSIQASNPAQFIRCLTFEKPLTMKTMAGGISGAIGNMLLLWIHQTYGLNSMVDLLRKAPTYLSLGPMSKSKYTPAKVKADIHKLYSEYYELVKEMEKEALSTSELITRSKKWESLQFVVALKDVTKTTDLSHIKRNFLNWIGLRLEAYQIHSLLT